jgi:hypothetical protein
LIYLAKLDAIGAFQLGGYRALIPEAVLEETTRPAVVYRHPDAVMIETAIAEAEVHVTTLTTGEAAQAQALSSSVSGLGSGESEVLAVAKARDIPAVVFERRGQAVARGHGIRLVDLIEVLFDGTRENDLLAQRIRRLAEMVDMRLADYEQLRDRIAQRRVG